MSTRIFLLVVLAAMGLTASAQCIPGECVVSIETVHRPADALGATRLCWEWIGAWANDPRQLGCTHVATLPVEIPIPYTMGDGSAFQLPVARQIRLEWWVDDSARKTHTLLAQNRTEFLGKDETP